MLYCGTCGSKAYGGRHVPTGRVAYSCKQASYYKLHRGGYVNEDKILEHLLPWLEKLADEINALADAEPAHVQVADPAPAIRRAIIKLDSRRDVLTDKMPAGLVPDDVYRRKLAELDQEKTQQQQRLQDIEAAQKVGELHLTADLVRDWPSMQRATRAAIEAGAPDRLHGATAKPSGSNHREMGITALISASLPPRGRRLAIATIQNFLISASCWETTIRQRWP